MIVAGITLEAGVLGGCGGEEGRRGRAGFGAAVGGAQVGGLGGKGGGEEGCQEKNGGACGNVTGTEATMPTPVGLTRLCGTRRCQCHRQEYPLFVDSNELMEIINSRVHGNMLFFCYISSVMMECDKIDREDEADRGRMGWLVIVPSEYLKISHLVPFS